MRSVEENGGIEPSASDHATVKESLVEEFEKESDPKDDFRRAVNATMLL